MIWRPKGGFVHPNLLPTILYSPTGVGKILDLFGLVLFAEIYDIMKWAEIIARRRICWQGLHRNELVKIYTFLVNWCLNLTLGHIINLDISQTKPDWKEEEKIVFLCSQCGSSKFWHINNLHKICVNSFWNFSDVYGISKIMGMWGGVLYCLMT